MDGILVGCDSNQEWLLSWWYHNLREHNPDVPIAFGDLGMSEVSRRWCEQRGILIAACQINSISMPTSDLGWQYGGERWQCIGFSSSQRPVFWFRKPFLMKESPFDRTLWLDLDCQVLGTLSSLFSLRLPSTKFAIRSGPYTFGMQSNQPGRFLIVKSHNCGTVLFEKGSSLLEFWVLLINQAGHNFHTEDQVLSFAINKYHFPIGKIPYKYNWLTRWGNNPEAVVLHWAGQSAKTLLRLIC